MEVTDLKAPEPVQGRPPWQDPQWLAAAEDWIDAECARAAMERTGPARARARPYSVVARVPTDGGTVWFKASPPAGRFEPALLVALAAWQRDLRIAPLARALTWGRLFPCYLGHPGPGVHSARALAAMLEPDPLGAGDLACRPGGATVRSDERFWPREPRTGGPIPFPVPAGLHQRRPRGMSEGSTMTAATGAGEFASETEPFRRELLAHCYRMIGSPDEAEDLVQETYLRAWRSYGTFEGRSSLRSWLYRIATNVCLTALEQRGRRALPTGLGGPADDPDAPVTPAGAGQSWLEPIPDARVVPDAADPAEVVLAGEGLRLALIASLQYLAPRQRAVLVLREVLGFPAAEVAEMLGVSNAAVKSALQRGRARLGEVAPAPGRLVEPSDPRAREQLALYIAGFENADLTALEKALRADAEIEMVGTLTWFSGRVTCLRYLARVVGQPGDYLMTPTLANGQPAAAAYQRGDDGRYRAFGLGVLTVTGDGIAKITVFGGGARLVEAFGLPAVADR